MGAHVGPRHGGGQELVPQDGPAGWLASPSLSDGQRLLPDLCSWSIERDPFREKPRVRFACPGYGLRAASWWRAAQHRPNRPSPRWTRRRRWRHTAYSAHGKGEWPAPDARPLRTSDPFLKQPRSEEHTSELQSLMRISYAVFCLKKKKNTRHN